MANENDSEFMDYIERLGPQCKSIRELVKETIAEHLKEQAPSDPSGTYLEAQNRMLLTELLKLKGVLVEPSTPPESHTSGQKNGKPELELEPKLEEPKVETTKKPFWR